MLSVLIDTSNRNLSVGIAQDGVLLDFVEYDAWQKQSEYLVNELHNLFAKHGLDPRKTDEVIAAKGPGSYTGVRIAVSVAKVMAFALHIPLYLVSSLCDMRDGEKPSICLMNARGKRSYIGVYEGMKAILPDAVLENDKVLSYIAAHPEYSVMGDTSYLGIEGKAPKLLENLLRSKTAETLVPDPIAAKPVYLKDLA